MTNSQPDPHEVEAKRAKAEQARRLARFVADVDTRERLEAYADELERAAAALDRPAAPARPAATTFDQRATLARAIAERVDVPSLAATWLVIARQYEVLATFPRRP